MSVPIVFCRSMDSRTCKNATPAERSEHSGSLADSASPGARREDLRRADRNADEPLQTKRNTLSGIAEEDISLGSRPQEKEISGHKHPKKNRLWQRKKLFVGFSLLNIPKVS